MSNRSPVLVALLAAMVPACATRGPTPVATTSPRAPAGAPARAIRRDLPMTASIRRAFAAGTRDSSGRPGARYWQLRTEYTIAARLEPSTGTVSGRETIVVHNTSPTSMHTIQLRLDQNFFRPDAERDEPLPGPPTAGMKVTRLTVDGTAADLNPAPRRYRQQPAAGPPAVPTVYGITTTSAQVLLPRPVPPGGRATLEADWSFEVPAVPIGRGERMGRWADTLFQVAQWYPRVAVFDDLRQTGWDMEPYLGGAEFYNNFGHFDVSLDVPAGWLVGATGVLQDPAQVLTATARERLSHVLESDSLRTIVGGDEQGPGRSTAAGERLVWHFVADTVGDFAWATSSHYVWDATRATIPGQGPVPIYLFYLPGDAGHFVNAADIARHALEFYSRLWMPYSFPQLTLADGPELGMEYPMFIMSAAGAADHEAGHEWWPMTLGTNETWYGWMDEGLNEYMNILSAADREHTLPELDGRGQAYGQISGNELEPPLMWPSNYGGPYYEFQAYGKAPEMLAMLGGIVGDSAVWRAMSGYAHAWRFKHPSPWDYAFFMDRALGRDLDWFWYYWLFTTESVDGSIQDVSTAGGRTTVTVRQDGQMPAPIVLQVKFAPSGPAIRPMPNSVMTDATTAIVTWPVDVWFDGSRTFSAVLDFGGRPIEGLRLDPHGRFPDHNPGDNVWPRGSAQTGASR